MVMRCRRMPALTWAGRLDLGLVLFGFCVEDVWGRVLASLNLALKGVQTLDVLFLQRAGCAARRAYVQVGGQLPPLLVLVHLVGDRERRQLRELHKKHNSFLWRSKPPVLWSVIEAYLSEAPNLLDGHVESEEVERLASHSRQVVHAHGLLLSEGQESVHPHLPLWLRAELIQTSNLLVGDGGRAWLLQHRRLKTIMSWEENHQRSQKNFVTRTPNFYLFGFRLGSPFHFVVYLRSRVHFIHAKLRSGSHSWVFRGNKKRA